MKNSMKRLGSFSRWRLVQICLCLAALPCVATARNWTAYAEIPAHEGNLTFRAPWRPDQGASFRLAKPDSKLAAVIDIRHEGCRLSLVGPGSTAEEEPRVRSQGDALPDRPVEQAEWTLKIRRRDWTLYIEDRPVFVFNAPFEPPAVLYRLTDRTPADDAPKPRFQRTGVFEFNDNFFLPGDTRDPLVDWDRISGAWRLRTAADVIAERGETLRRKRTREPDPEHSVNFSSVRGQGAPAIMLAGHDFYDRYTMETALNTAPGEAGLVFCRTRAGAYHALTLTLNESSPKALLRLWRTSGQSDAPRETLAACVTELERDQWMKLKIELYPDRILGFLDNAEIFNVAAAMPTGGRFGLYAHSKDGFLFDDVRVRSNPNLYLNDRAGIRWHTVAEEGDFFPDNPPADAEENGTLNVSARRRDQWLVLGDPDHPGHVFSADVRTQPDSGRIGLVIGYRDDRTPYRLWTRTVERGTEILKLEQVGSGSANVLETLRLPVPDNPDRSPVTLMADATHAGVLRLYRNGVLVLAHHSGPDHRGASGLFVGANTVAAIDRVRYQFERDDLYHDMFEKNQVFREDPFMRNWASPEGEWAQDPHGLTWHKGDFYGRFFCRMPSVEGSEIHLGVPEDSVMGSIVVSVVNREILLQAFVADGRETLARAPVDSLARLVCEQTQWATPYYDIHYEDHALWIASGDSVLIRHQLAKPMTGRRLRIDGFGSEDLAHSYVQRYNVKDMLFTESLHEWIRNGGEWSVINRFQCDPRWSHMNGESLDGRAALWSKFDFSGDFCIEMYAGMRHEFYERAGDLNLTVMSSALSPGQGYTVTCTGWDTDHSQRYTRLYKNGRILAETDRTLVPRRREGQVRVIRDPLVQEGRDMHGAWYYIKLRRTGDKLEYFFDNEPVFSVRDDDPIDGGPAGLWTFMNSMMVARVKMAAERLAPRPRVFRPVSPDTGLDDLVRPPDYYALHRRGVLARNWRPAESLLPHQWKAEDPTGLAQLTWATQPETPPAFLATAVPGAGDAFTRANLQPDPYPELVGWSFEVKRTADARFNFHFSLGTLAGDGAFNVEAQCFHRLSGDAFAEGEYVEVGGTEVNSHSEPGEDWTEREDWTPVTVWLPTESEAGLDAGQRLWVRVDGFGNLKPSAIRQGLLGNGPGEAYAIRRFSEIRNHPPRLDGALPGDTVDVVCLSSDPPRSLGTCASVDELRALIARLDTPGAIHLNLMHRAADAVWPHDWRWLNLPSAQEMTIRAEWHPDIPEAIRIEHAADWNDRRFMNASIRQGTHTTESWIEGPNRRVAFVPRLATMTQARQAAVPVEVRIENRTHSFSLPWLDAPLETEPVLLGLGDTFPLYESFESRTLPRTLDSNGPRFRIRHLDPQQGSYLRVANAGRQERLRASFLRTQHLAQAPLVQFRYRARDMANISIALPNNRAVRLSEAFENAASVRGSGPLITDGTWHTWFGIVSDGLGDLFLRNGAMRMSGLAFGSRHEEDQTGLFAQWDLDNLVWGPTVSRHRPLSLIPDYFSFRGVDSVFMALHPGETPACELDTETLTRLTWIRIPNRAPTQPDLSSLPNGIHRIFLKARSATGLESALADVPFLLDTRAPSASVAFVETSDPVQNRTALEIAFDTGATGSPLNFDGMQLKLDGKPFAFQAFRGPVSGPFAFAHPTLGSDYRHTPETAFIRLNYAYLFRDRIQNLAGNDTFTLSLENLQDGGGNPIDTVHVPVGLDYARDNAPPTLLETRYPDNVFWKSGWESAMRNQPYIQTRNPNRIVRNPDEEPWLEHTTRGDTGFFWTRLGAWRIARHPWLAFQIRCPDVVGQEDMRVYLSLKRGRRNYIHIPLNDNKGPSRYPPNEGIVATLPEPVSWEPDLWYPFVLDMRELTAGKIPKAEWENRPADLLIFTAETTTGRPMRMEIKSVFIFSDWGPTDAIGVAAYDASGVDTGTWTVGDKTFRANAFAPGAAFPGDTPDRWMRTRVLDRAGNASFAWDIPLGRIPTAAEDRARPASVP